jgi:aminoglycoside 3-N-acetyltransferase I
MDMRVKRLDSSNRQEAQRLFILIAEVFEENCDTLNDPYLDQLLCRKDFWALAVFAGDDIIGGVTAHTLPMTYNE